MFVGVAEPWKPFRGEDALRALEGVEIVPLDIGDEKSVADLAADIGGKVDILVNTSEHVRAGGLLDRQGTSVVRDEIDQSYLGFVHLAQAFGPAMRMRGSDGVNSAAAWVNILSVYALANWPMFRRVFGVAGRLSVAVALPAGGASARRRQGGERVYGAARYRMVPDGAAAEGRAAARSPSAIVSALSADWKMCSWAMSPRIFASALRPTPRRSSVNSGRRRVCWKREKRNGQQWSHAICRRGRIRRGARRRSDVYAQPGISVIVLPPEFGQAAPVRIQQISRYDASGPAWYWNNLTFGEHTGTHFDAPIHWFTGKDLPNNSVDTLPVRDMIAPACVIDCSAQAAKDADFLLTIPVVEAWEKSHGRIPERHWVLLRTDWSKKGWRDYANLKDDGAHTPGPDPAVMRWLVEERGVIGFGTETIGTDAGQAGHLDPPYPAHHFLHGGGRYGLQCLCNLDQLPPTGAVIVAAPLKIQNGSGSPLRVLALVPGQG